MAKDVSKMTLTRALVQLKLLDKRIKKATEEVFITYQVSDKKHIDCDPAAALKSVEDLIAHREKIKAAIMAANAKTTVSIDGAEMTIIAAIEKKKTIAYLEGLRTSLIKQFANTHRQIESENGEMQFRLDRLLEANAGKDLKTRDAEIETITKAYKISNEAKPFDPIDIEKKVKDLDESIDNFLAEVDLCLSEVNATTTIDIP